MRFYPIQSLNTQRLLSFVNFIGMKITNIMILYGDWHGIQKQTDYTPVVGITRLLVVQFSTDFIQETQCNCELCNYQIGIY